MRRAIIRAVIDLHAHILPGLDDGPPTLDASAGDGRAPRPGRDAGDGRDVARRPGLRAGPRRPRAGASARLGAPARGRHRARGRAGRRGVAVAAARPRRRRPARAHARRRRRGCCSSARCRRTRGDGARGRRAAPARLRACCSPTPSARRASSVAAGRCSAWSSMGALAQLTSTSFSGRFGEPARKAAFEMLERGPRARDRLRRAWRATAARRTSCARSRRRAALRATPRDLFDWMTTGVPGAILDGGPLPPRPPLPRRRGLLKRLTGS